MPCLLKASPPPLPADAVLSSVTRSSYLASPEAAAIELISSFASGEIVPIPTFVPLSKICELAILTVLPVVVYFGI